VELILKRKAVITAARSLKHASCSVASGANGIPLLETRFVITIGLDIGAPVTRSICGSIRHSPAGRTGGADERIVSASGEQQDRAGHKPQHTRTQYNHASD
jgi:hypothetical protein